MLSLNPAPFQMKTHSARGRCLQVHIFYNTSDNRGTWTKVWNIYYGFGDTWECWHGYWHEHFCRIRSWYRYKGFKISPLWLGQYPSFCHHKWKLNQGNANLWRSPFLRNISGLTIDKLLDYDRYTIVTLKVNFERNLAFLDASYNQPKQSYCLL